MIYNNITIDETKGDLKRVIGYNFVSYCLKDNPKSISMTVKKFPFNLRRGINTTEIHGKRVQLINHIGRYNYLLKNFKV